MKRLLFNPLLSIILAALAFSTYAQESSVVYKSLQMESSIIEGGLGYSIYLPPSYGIMSKKQYKLLYLLHGYGGDENSWVDRCKVQHIMDSLIAKELVPEMVVIMPEARNSYYINNFDRTFLFEDFFIQELIPNINLKYRVDTSYLPAICGLSMGGFGAIILPFKHPERFSHSIALSAAVRTPLVFKSLPQDRYNTYFGNVYGPNIPDSLRITEHWKQNSPFYLMDSSIAERISSVNWFIDCGMHDFLFPVNDAFHRLLLKNNIAHEFHMRVGKHNWEYWRKGFISSMVYLGENWGLTGTTKKL